MFRVLGYIMGGGCILMGLAFMGDPKAPSGFLILFGLFSIAMNYYGGIAGIFGAVRNSMAKSAMESEITTLRAASNHTAAVADTGDIHERLAAIDAFYAVELNAMTATMADAIPSLLTRRAIEKGVTEAAQKVTSDLKNVDTGASLTLAVLKDVSSGVNLSQIVGGVEGAVFTRTLRDLTDGERASLRLADMLHALGVIPAQAVQQVRLPILWNDGNCGFRTLSTISTPDKQAAVREALKMVMLGTFGNAAAAMELVQDGLRKALKEDALAPDVRASLERYVVRGARWMTPTEGRSALCGDLQSPSALRLGSFVGSSDELLYDKNESLVTIAPPGAGKSQAHVLRNLLHMKAPAVVLDVKGEMARSSARWRAENVGPVFVYAPSMPKITRHYNPLDAVRSDPMTAWDDARKLADLLVIPSSPKGGDSYFEDRARDMIATAILDVALTESPEQRNMSSVLERLYISEDEKVIAWCDHLATINTQMRRQADALRGMPAKQREGVFDSARRYLDVWQAPALEEISSITQFSADELRQQNGTLYLVVPLEEIKRLAPVLRVVIGQMIYALCRDEPESGALPVTFFLDEMPRLGRMDVIEEGLDVGRGYGVRFWLFCQNLGQLENAYPNAQGIMSNCAARCFMNPDENGARWMANNLGQREGMIDGKRKPLVEQHQLTGPEFENQVVCFLKGHHPARLVKSFAYSDAETATRITPKG